MTDLAKRIARAKQDDARDSTVGAEPVASERPSPHGHEWTPDRDDLGRKVRAAWVAWAKTQPDPKASWLVPYDELSEADKEADRQIGEALTIELAELAEGLEKWGDEQHARAETAEASLASGRADGIREGLERAANEAAVVEEQQEIDHGSANTGGAAQASTAIRALINAGEEAENDLSVGARVTKTSGYPFPGEIVAVFYTKSGDLRIVVEATGHDYAGMLHIFNPNQLEPRHAD